MKTYKYSQIIKCVEKFKKPSATIPTECPTLSVILERASQGVPLNLCGTPQFDKNEDIGEARVSSENVPLSEVRSAGINGDFNKKPNKASQKPSNKEDESQVVKGDDKGGKPAEEPTTTENES